MSSTGCVTIEEISYICDINKLNGQPFPFKKKSKDVKFKIWICMIFMFTSDIIEIAL